jgi:glutamate synthase (NADPH/NADH) small chain
VTVFEADQDLGGLLRVGIPDFRLEKTLIDRRIEQMRAEGVSFRTGVRVGQDISAADLRKQFDAVLLATGARRQRDLDVPGRDLKGVHLAMDFLRAGCTAAAGGGPGIDAKGKTVAVIGGGLTGADCVELAINQGAAGVHQLEILPESAAAAGMAAQPGENVQRHWSVSTRQFCGNGAALASLRAVRVEWVSGPNGRGPRELPGAELALDADLAVLALGFDAVIEPELAQQLGLAADQAGQPIIKDFQTSVEGIFAAGDLVTGAGIVAAAIASGRKAAEKIHAYLTRPAPTAAIEAPHR